MRINGKIVEWIDERGFGFVVEDGGTEKIFSHIKSFENRKRRPSVGDVVSFEKRRDENNRLLSINIRFQSEKVKNSKITFGYYFTILFIFFILLSFYFGFIHVYVLWVYFSISILTAIIYAFDKSAAKRNEWRTNENTLQLLSLCGGWPGAFFAQKLLHHKSSKVEFLVVFWVIVIINCSILAWLFTKEGKELLSKIVILIESLG